MKNKYLKGEWLSNPPQGYRIVRENGERKVMLNETGHKLKKIWEWKLQGMKNEEIMINLRKIGVPIYKQQLHKIIKNPFYCGLIAHGILDGKIVEGKQEKLISKELFFKVNDIIRSSSLYGVPHKAEDNNLPLKVFVWCAKCNTPFTGYVVKKKNLYYYKCRTTGCKCNKSVKEMHSKFESILSDVAIKAELIKPIMYQLENTFADMNKENSEKEQILKGRMTEINTKVSTLEEKYFIGEEMTKEMYDKFITRFREEYAEIARDLEICTTGISNHREMLKKAVEFCRNLRTVWLKGSIKIKEKLQKLLFPEGLAYDREVEAFRTDKINSVIALIARLSGDSAIMQKGLTPFFESKSLLADRTGTEPYPYLNFSYHIYSLIINNLNILGVISG